MILIILMSTCFITVEMTAILSVFKNYLKDLTTQLSTLIKILKSVKMAHASLIWRARISLLLIKET